MVKFLYTKKDLTLNIYNKVTNPSGHALKSIPEKGVGCTAQKHMYEGQHLVDLFRAKAHIQDY